MHNVTASGNRPLERRLADLSVWYHRNRGHFGTDNLAAKQAFLEKAFWIVLETLALTTERLHELEDRGKPKELFLPRGLTVNGNLREFR